MSDNDQWFLEALHNAVSAGHVTRAGAKRIRRALELEGSDEFICVICGKDCRDTFGGVSKECRADYNAD